MSMPNQRKNHMKKHLIAFIPCALAAGLVIAGGLSAQAQTLLYSDNFDVPDTGNFNASSQAGRHAGLLAGNILPQSGGIQLTISGGQLNLLTPAAGTSTGRMRLENSGSLGTKWDFGSGAGGAAITTAGGMSVAFDWTAADNTSANWISYAVGFTNFDLNFSVVAPQTDSGILLRNNGGTALFANGTQLATGTNAFGVASLTHHVKLDYLFNSFADGTTVNLNAYIDGGLTDTQTFNWNGNSGFLTQEMASVGNGNRIDNYTISTVPEPATWAMMAGGFGMLLAARRFRRSQA